MNKFLSSSILLILLPSVPVCATHQFSFDCRKESDTLGKTIRISSQLHASGARINWNQAI
jgi:hypothetical protein